MTKEDLLNFHISGGWGQQPLVVPLSFLLLGQYDDILKQN